MPYRCAQCGAVYVVDRYRCPACRAADLTRIAVSSEGIISSWTQLAGPYGVSTLVLVRFADQTQSFGNLLCDKHDVSIGAAVQHVAALATSNGVRHLFRLAGVKCLHQEDF